MATKAARTANKPNQTKKESKVHFTDYFTVIVHSQRLTQSIRHGVQHALRHGLVRRVRQEMRCLRTATRYVTYGPASYALCSLMLPFNKLSDGCTCDVVLSNATENTSVLSSITENNVHLQQWCVAYHTSVPMRQKVPRSTLRGPTTATHTYAHYTLARRVGPCTTRLTQSRDFLDQDGSIISVEGIDSRHCRACLVGNLLV